LTDADYFAAAILFKYSFAVDVFVFLPACQQLCWAEGIVFGGVCLSVFCGER